jgi:2-polyprenyl-6-methoxyphenol hydroxylase-like FAD-dependent oxidoreductase
MAPNLGQGACSAIVNAVVLARAVSQDREIPRALRAWEQSERPYIDRTQFMSYLYGAIGTRWPHRLLDLRTKILPWLGKTALAQRNLRVALDHQPAI